MVNECKAPFEKRGAFFDTPCGCWEPAFSKNLPTPQAGVGDHEVVEGGAPRSGIWGRHYDKTDLVGWCAREARNADFIIIAAQRCTANWSYTSEHNLQEQSDAQIIVSR